MHVQNLNSGPQNPFVIFLDIDGVLYQSGDEVHKKVKDLFPNIERLDVHYDIAASHLFDKKSVNNLTKIIESIERVYKVSIVISSSWRIGKNVEMLRKIFDNHHFSKYINDKTPEKIKEKELREHDIRLNVCERVFQIQHWLKQHPEITDYLILDDIDDGLSAVFGKKFVKTNEAALLTDEIAQRVIAEFNSRANIETVHKVEAMIEDRLPQRSQPSQSLLPQLSQSERLQVPYPGKSATFFHLQGDWEKLHLDRGRLCRFVDFVSSTKDSLIEKFSVLGYDDGSVKIYMLFSKNADGLEKYLKNFQLTPYPFELEYGMTSEGYDQLKTFFNILANNNEIPDSHIRMITDLVAKGTHALSQDEYKEGKGRK